MTDVIEYMLHRPIHSCRIGQWAYTLFGYDLACAPLRSIRDQIVADFITEHRINDMHNMILALSLQNYGDYVLMVQLIAMDKVLVLFTYLFMVLFLKPYATQNIYMHD